MVNDITVWFQSLYGPQWAVGIDVPSGSDEFSCEICGQDIDHHMVAVFLSTFDEHFTFHAACMFDLVVRTTAGGLDDAYDAARAALEGRQ